ncbi:MAG: single-stranded DNA-binding protein, partial [Dehalococcoidia bacterium]
RTRSWDTPEGQKRYRTEVVADKVLFLDSPGGAPLPEEQGEGRTGRSRASRSRRDTVRVSKYGDRERAGDGGGAACR